MAIRGVIISRLTGPKIMIFNKCLVIGEVYIIANFLFIFRKFEEKLLVDPKHTVHLVSIEGVCFGRRLFEANFLSLEVKFLLTYSSWIPLWGSIFFSSKLQNFDSNEFIESVTSFIIIKINIEYRINIFNYSKFQNISLQDIFGANFARNKSLSIISFPHHLAYQ